MSGGPERSIQIPSQVDASSESSVLPRMKVRVGEPFTVPTPDFTNPYMEVGKGYGIAYERDERVPGKYAFEIEGTNLIGQVKIVQRSEYFIDKDEMHIPAGPVVVQQIMHEDSTFYDISTLPFNIVVDVGDASSSDRQGIPDVHVLIGDRTYKGLPTPEIIDIDDDTQDVRVEHNEFWRGGGVGNPNPFALPLRNGVSDVIKIIFVPQGKSLADLQDSVDTASESLEINEDTRAESDKSSEAIDKPMVTLSTEQQEYIAQTVGELIHSQWQIIYAGTPTTLSHAERRELTAEEISRLEREFMENSGIIWDRDTE